MVLVIKTSNGFRKARLLKYAAGVCYVSYTVLVSRKLIKFFDPLE